MSNIKRSELSKIKAENEFNAKRVKMMGEVISQTLTKEQCKIVDETVARRLDAWARGEDVKRIRAGVFDSDNNSDEQSKQNQNNDQVNHPSHYTQNKFESIDEMMIVFGPEVVYHFCICNAWKYKNRAPFKGNFKEDMKKADWYLTKAKAIKENKLWQE